MSLSKRVVETLIDLVEIKLSCVEVYDREDKREIAGLERCRQELQKMIEGGTGRLANEFKGPARATA